MRAFYTLTKTNPQQSVSLQFRAASCVVSNPTGSGIYIRQGGNDYPTADSATLTVPAQTVFQFPVVGPLFAFTFATPALVGTSSVPAKSAQIMLLDATEKIGAFGLVNIAPQQLPPYYARVGAAIIGFAYNATGVAPHGVTTRFSYTVPTGFALYLELVRAQLFRDSAAATPGVAGAVIRLASSGNFALSEISRAMFNSGTAFASDKDSLTPPGFAGQNDQVDAFTVDNSLNGTIAYNLIVKGVLYPTT